MSRISEKLSGLNNETLRAWLKLVRETETPPLFHAWSLVSAASACLTRRCWFNLGAIKVMPNQYVLLVGPPGVRKSTAISLVRDLVSDVQGIRFAPNSTAGRLQGLLAAFKGRREGNEAEDEVSEVLEAAGRINFGVEEDERHEENLGSTHVLNRHALYVAEGEFTTFSGMKMDEFIDFLGDMWDKSGADEFEYSLKREVMRIGLPCMNIIGGITPMHITSYLPPQAIGQGFTSRVILVYEDEAKSNAWPEPLDEQGMKDFKKIMRFIFESMEGPFQIEQGVKQRVIELYSYRPAIEDARFIHYTQRRQAHMLKVAMALAALRLSMEVTVADIDDAHALLVLAEARMSESLGEYGLSPVALAQTRIKEYLRNCHEPISQSRLLMACGSDVAKADFGRALMALVETNSLIEVKLRDPQGLVRTGYAWPRQVNPFKQHDTITVEYLHDEIAGGATKRATKSIDHLASAFNGAPPEAKIPEVNLPDQITAVAETLTLAAQGFTSIADKIASFTSRKDTIQ